MKCDFRAALPPGIVALVLPQNELAHAVDDRESRLPTSAEIVEINRRHLIDTPLKPADLLFVFGTRQDVALRVEEALRLWREGFFRWGIVSGGVTPGGEPVGMRGHQGGNG